LNFVNSKNLFKDVKFYWYYSGSFKPVHFYSDIKLNIDVYNQPGIECLNFEIKRINHNKAYNNRPTFSSQIGVNYISKVDTNRTKLYSKGNFASLYVNYGVINNFFKHSLTLSSSLPISTSWNFIKIKYSVSGKSVKILSSENILRSTLGITHAGLRSRMF
jgi:hypothetical protein